MTDECSAGAPSGNGRPRARAGAQHQAPRPTLFVDFGEQNPFNLSYVSGWSEGIEKRGVGEGTRWFTSVPRSSLPLVQVQRLQSDPVRQQCIYSIPAQSLTAEGDLEESLREIQELGSVAPKHTDWRS